MQKGYLIVNVYHDDETKPLENANVKIIGENYSQSFTTNTNGKTEKITLEAPDKKYSLYPQYEIKPYATYDLTVTKSGFNTVTIKNVEVFADEIGLENVYLKQKPGSTENINLPEHDLWTGHNQDQSSGEDYSFKPQEQDEVSSRIMPSVIIPEFIRVKNGTPTSNAAVLTVPFKDYIKNVASSEIFPTWHRQALIANVNAIVSFTLNRVFTEWYPSRGFNFTISASPAFDQAFVNNRTIFQSISDVVDEFFRDYIRLNNTTHPFFAQYNDGRQTNIPGRLSQWGSQEMATRGSTAIQILRHFYTPNLTVLAGHEVVGLPSSFPGYNLRVGSCGNPVRDLQTRLNRIRANFPAIPTISPVDGRFGDNTRRSVEAFQRAFNMPVTGVVDIATWLRISNIFTAVAGLQHGVR